MANAFAIVQKRKSSVDCRCGRVLPKGPDAHCSCGNCSKSPTIRCSCGLIFQPKQLLPVRPGECAAEERFIISPVRRSKKEKNKNKVTVS